MNQKMTLAELQQAFHQAVFEPGAEDNKALYAQIKPLGELSAEKLVDVYRSSILGGLTEALNNIYPVCLALVGEQFFNHMVADYLRLYPSGSPDLADYGERFPAYLLDFTPAKELVYLPDVAALELCWHRAFNAAEDLTDGVKSLAELADVTETEQGSIGFHLTPSAFLLRSDYPIQRIWEVSQKDYQGTDTVDLDEGGVCLVIWRNVEFGMRIDVLSEQEFVFLTAVNQGRLFAEIATMSCATELPSIIGRCIQTGLLAGFELKN